MAIQFPTAGAIYAVDFEATSVQAICDAIKNALATCGWTTVALPSSFTVTFSGLPTNNQTATIGGLGYTFVTSLTQATPRQVKIGATAAACATALMECINAGANSGTDYSNSTAAAGIFTAAVDATGLIVRITAVATGFATNSAITVTTGWTNTAWAECTNAGTAWGRGYRMVMPITPQGLSGAVWLEDVNAAYIRLRVGSPDGSFMSEVAATRDAVGAWSLNVSAGRLLHFLGCAHQLSVYMVGDSGSIAGTQFFFSVPYVKAINAPLIVTGASNASPIEITTSVNHGLVTGQGVFNADVGGNTAANGTFTITVTAANKYTLNGSTGNGAYTSGGVTGLTMSQIQRLMLALGDTSGSSCQTFRTSAWPCVESGTINPSINLFEALNVFVNKYSGSPYTASYGPRLFSARTATGEMAAVWGGIPRIVDAVVFWPVLGLGVSLFEVGQLWATFCTQEAVPADRMNTGFLGHNWTQICANSKVNNFSNLLSVWMATS